VRERWVVRRTVVISQIRGLLLEHGLTPPKGRSHVDHALPGILADATSKLSDSFRVLLSQLKVELDQLSARIEELDRVIQHTAKENEACQRLTTIPGIGPGDRDRSGRRDRQRFRISKRAGSGGMGGDGSRLLLEIMYAVKMK
jgi:transposase